MCTLYKMPQVAIRRAMHLLIYSCIPEVVARAVFLLTYPIQTPVLLSGPAYIVSGPHLASMYLVIIFLLTNPTQTPVFLLGPA